MLLQLSKYPQPVLLVLALITAGALMWQQAATTATPAAHQSCVLLSALPWVPSTAAAPLQLGVCERRQLLTVVRLLCACVCRQHHPHCQGH